MTYLNIISSAIEKCLIESKRSIYIGEDVKHGFCGITNNFGTMAKKKLIDMPISESCFTGMGLGLGISGYTTFIEYNFSGLTYISMDQIYNQIYKYQEMTGRRLSSPITIIMPTGTKGYRSVHHSDNTYTTFVQLGVPCHMPVLEEHIKLTMDRIMNDGGLHLLYLPMQEFREERKTLKCISTNTPISYIVKYEKSKSCIISSGTAIEESILAAESIKDTIPVDIVTFSNLNDACKVYTELNNSGLYQNFFLADDGIGPNGIFSEISQQENVTSIHRENNIIPFNQCLENQRRCTRDRIVKSIVSNTNGAKK